MGYNKKTLSKVNEEQEIKVLKLLKAAGPRWINQEEIDRLNYLIGKRYMSTA